MGTTTRNWSAIADRHKRFREGEQNAFLTRGQWIEKALSLSHNVTDQEREDEESYLHSLDDEELMFHIQEVWGIEIRDTTWLKVGNKCYWKDPCEDDEAETSQIYTIAEIQMAEDNILDEDTIILLSNIDEGGGECEAYLCECYGLTDRKCKRCGSTAYISDLCSYPYVCLECDENLYGIETI